MGQAEQPLPSMSAGVDGPTHWKVIQPIKPFERVCRINAALYVSGNGWFQGIGEWYHQTYLIKTV